jgi:hypothetical protein
MAITPAKRGAVRDTRIELFENTAITLTRRQDFISEIGKLWLDAQNKFVLIGRYLIQAKEILPHGEFEAMIERELPFGRAVAHQLRTVAEVIDAGRLPVERLPANYSTVYQITTLNDDERQAALDAGVIRPDVTRAEVIAFKKTTRQAESTLDRAALLRRRAKLAAEIEHIDAQLAEMNSRPDDLRVSWYAG